MLDQHDLQWLAAHASQLNSLLQQVSRCSDHARLHRDEDRYLDLLAERVEQASRRSQEIFDRLVSSNSSGTQDVVPFAPARKPNLGDKSSNVIVKPSLGQVEFDLREWREPAIRNPDGKRELILVVDDDEEVLERTAEMLDFEDYRLVLAKDGPEALRIYKHLGDQITLVLLDYFLPVMDGDAVFEELKAMNPHARVVLTSGFGEQSKLGNMLGNGLCGFIPKPYTHEKLVEQLRLILDA
jgi:CheY-like chemotaxis protein